MFGAYIILVSEAYFFLLVNAMSEFYNDFLVWTLLPSYILAAVFTLGMLFLVFLVPLHYYKNRKALEVMGEGKMG